jgi:hypothetical protein
MMIAGPAQCRGGHRQRAASARVRRPGAAAPRAIRLVKVICVDGNVEFSLNAFEF